MMTPRSPSSSGSAAHFGRGEPHHIEAADQVDLDDAPEVIERHRPVAPDDAPAAADAGAIDGDARRPVPLAAAANAASTEAASVTSAWMAKPPVSRAASAAAGSLMSRIATFTPELRQRLRARPAETRSTAADDCRLSFDEHCVLHSMTSARQSERAAARTAKAGCWRSVLIGGIARVDAARRAVPDVRAAPRGGRRRWKTRR